MFDNKQIKNIGRVPSRPLKKR